MKMARAALLGVLWICSIAGLASAKAVVNCLDGQKCDDVHAVVQGPQDVAEVMRLHQTSKSVDFHGNLLTQFMNSYTREVRWERLNLSYNLLENDIFSRLSTPQLKYIDITYNSLTTVTVPASVVEFIAERNNLTRLTINSRILQKLILPKNKLFSLNGFGYLPQLEHLDLSCNQLEKLNVDELSSMSRLNSLNVANNRIHIVENTRSLPSLQNLDLSGNLLTMIDEPFLSFPNIGYLYLQNNRIVMWTIKNFSIRNLQQINIQNNDWDCKSLDSLKANINGKMVRGSANVTCTSVDSPYADRVINYRKQEFEALEKGTSQRTGNISCNSYKPNPCDGDDNRVYEVARAAVTSVESGAKNSEQKLAGQLEREKSILNNLQDQIRVAEEGNEKLSRENEDLVNYVKEEYQKAGLNRNNDVFAQLNEIFDYFDNNNKKLKEEIKAEELKNGDTLDQINAIEESMGDVEYQKNQLLEDLNNRNSTVIGYQTRIKELEKKLSQRQT